MGIIIGCGDTTPIAYCSTHPIHGHVIGNKPHTEHANTIWFSNKLTSIGSVCSHIMHPQHFRRGGTLQMGIGMASMCNFFGLD